MKIEFYRHNIGDEEIARVTEVLRSPILTTGAVTAEFEAALARYLGTRHAVGVTSCTTAMILALKALGISEGDEVITTPMSFIATASAILHAGAKPVFVDVESETGNIDADNIETALTPATRAILPVHLYGQMADMRKMRALADRRGLKIVEDAAHALESIRDGARPTQLSDAACFSFYATKNITSGEGGALAVNDPALAETLIKLRLHGMTKDAQDRYTAPRYQHYDMELLGYKANMDNIQAALLLPQLALVEKRLERREAICRRYEEAFSAMPGVDFPKTLSGSRSARHLFTIWVAPERRDEILWNIQARGVGLAVNFRPIHLMKYFRDRYGFREGMFPNAERIGTGTITLPLYPRLTDEQVEYVIESVRKALAVS